MGSALWAGISGLSASSKQLDVIANNLANVNTIGYKSGETFFGDVLSSSISGGASGTMQVGRGVAVSTVQTSFAAGSFESTGNATDAAIDGDGFFMVNDNENGTYYTRAGAFHLNSDGLLVDINDYKVQGQMIVNGVLSSLGDISLQGLQSAPAVTTTVALGANLNAATATGGTYTTTQTVYDSLGAKHTLNTIFTRTAFTGTTDDAASCWGVQCSLDSNPMNSITANGFIFDSDGVCRGLYTGTSSAVAAEHNTVGAVTGIDSAPSVTTTSLVGGGAGFTSPVNDDIILKRGANDTVWTADAATLVKYPHMVITADATSVTIDADSTDGIASDLTLALSGTWEVNDTAAFTVTKGATSISTAATETEVNPPNAVASLVGGGAGFTSPGTDDIILTRGANATDPWTADAATLAKYPNMVITADATSVTIDADNTDGIASDLTLALTGTWNQNDTAAFSITKGPIALVDTDATITEANPPVVAAALSNNGNGFTSVGTYSITLTRGANATDPWTADAATLAKYPDMAITADATSVTVDADNDGNADLTLAISGTWNQNDTVTFGITKGAKTVGAATATAVNAAPTATAFLDHPGAVSVDGTMILKCDDYSANSWSISNLTTCGYPKASIVSANDTTVNIDLDNDGVTDAHLTLAGTWNDNDTATFALNNTAKPASTATVTLNRPGMIYQTGDVRLTKDATAWRLEGIGVYAKATVTSAGLTEPVTISLDGTGTTDITLTPTPANSWATGDTAVFTLTNTPSALNDITLSYTTPALNGGATIGAGGDINWNLKGDGALDITQYSSSSVTRSISTDGYSSGQLKSLSIDTEGKISGFFTNGQTSELAQLILASFPNPWGLSKLGKNLFGETITSGSSLRNIPGASGMGSLTPSTLEMSNTDIASEFVKMITAQKAYQANAKIVTTEDQMMSVLMSIKQ